MVSKRYSNTKDQSLRFDPDALATRLEEAVPEAQFCLLMGSAVGGEVAEGCDLDLAFFLFEKPTLELYTRVPNAVNALLPKVRCDIGILNSAEPVYRFEALKGRLMFVRDEEFYQRFFSLTCREYESQMADYERQQCYRREALYAL